MNLYLVSRQWDDGGESPECIMAADTPDEAIENAEAETELQNTDGDWTVVHIGTAAPEITRGLVCAWWNRGKQ